MIYFDNAATTYPKPPEVIREMNACMREYGGNPGRSGHPLALAAAEAVYGVRCRVSSFFGAHKPENVLFTKNATEALNLVLAGLARPRAHFIISDLEHNSVYRPIANLCHERGMTFDVFHALRCDDEMLAEIESFIRPETVAVVALHASNVCPRVLPLQRIGELCRKHGILYVVDGAQSAGLYDIDMGRDGVSVLCAPGHKALYGPQGSGFAVFADDFNFLRLSPCVYGGNGRNSNEMEMGHEPPESYEAGTVATPCIVGLGAGIAHIQKVGRQKLEERENVLYAYAKSCITALPRVRLYLPEATYGSLLLLGFDGISPSAVSAALGESGVCTRAGLHCAPGAHQALETGGDALRISFSATNTMAEIDRMTEILMRILG